MSQTTIFVVYFAVMIPLGVLVGWRITEWFKKRR